MIRQIISKALLIVYIACVMISGDDTEYRTHEAERAYMLSQDYCTIDELGEMDYYLFCGTQIHKSGTGSGVESKPSIINNDTRTIEEAKELYQRFRETLPLDDEQAEIVEPGSEDERTEVLYVSPDCKWIITDRWSNFQNVITTTLFVEKEKIREEVYDGIDEITPIIIIKDGEQYKQMDDRHYKQLSEIVWVNSYDIVYSDLKGMSEEGDLIAIMNDDHSLLTIRRVEDGTERWSYDLEEIKEEVWKRRDDMQKGDWIRSTVWQFDGNEQEGWLVIQARSSFYKIAYPSGEVTYLGEYLYSPSFSPDGRYLAYSSVDFDNRTGLKQIEYEQTPPPGIYIKEIETGKTAYIYWDPYQNPEEDYFEYRKFLWIEKDSFEEYMGDVAISGQDTKDEAIDNPYFPYREHTFLKGHAQYYDNCGEFIEETVDAEIIKVKEYGEGSVYRLTIDVIADANPWYFDADEFLSVYFYVTDDKIYRMFPYCQLEPGGKSIRFYNDDELLAATFDTEEILQSRGVFMPVCQEEELQEDLYSIRHVGNRITYDYLEIDTNKDRGAKELFVWEKGKGLAAFETGWGAGLMSSVHVDEICEVMKAE